MPLAWLIEWQKKNPGSLPTAPQRIHLLRYVLLNHFFTDWYPDEALMLRDLLDFVQDRAGNGHDFPEVCEIRNHLATYVKPVTGNPPAWLRKIDDTTVPGGHLVLPLTPIEWTNFLQNWVASHNGWLPDTNNYGGLLPGLADDLLMWSQRHVMDEWFRVHAQSIALFGTLGQPWDRDHIVPYSYFDTRRVSPPHAHILSTRLSASWLGLTSAKPDWRNFANIRNRFGNMRLWPFGFNRSHGNTPAKSKLRTPWLTKRDPWDVLSYWPRVPALGNPILPASRIDTKLRRCWYLTPSKFPIHWTETNVKVFLYATLSQRGREISIYRELFKVLEEGLKCHADWSNGVLGNRWNQGNRAKETGREA